MRSDRLLATTAVTEATPDTLNLVVDIEARSDDPSTAWLSLAAALATADAVRSAAALPVEVEWPATLAVPGGMCGGAAGSRHVGAVRLAAPESASTHRLEVVLRVEVRALDLDSGTTSIAASGGRADREALTAAITEQVHIRVRQWRAQDPELATDYRARCATIGRRLPSGEGWISGIDAEGQLVVSD